MQNKLPSNDHKTIEHIRSVFKMRELFHSMSGAIETVLFNNSKSLTAVVTIFISNIRASNFFLIFFFSKALGKRNTANIMDVVTNMTKWTSTLKFENPPLV